MIELRVKGDDYYSSLLLTTAILNWLLKKLDDKKNLFDGFLTLADKKSTDYVTILMCDMPVQLTIHNILQQPPGEFEGKYISHWVNDDPVMEGTDGEMKIEVEEIPAAAAAAAGEDLPP